MNCSRCKEPMDVLKGAATYTLVCYHCKRAESNGRHFWMGRLTLIKGE
jgi:hypothetical protein